MIDIVVHNQTHVETYGEQFFRRICDAAAPYLSVPDGHTGEVGISLIDEEQMRALNLQHRHKDASTDVLSFPLPTQPIPGYTAVSLGDLFISPSDVARKAQEQGRTVDEQMAWTVVHGLLHLVGYDHEISSEAAEKMFTLEQTILHTLQ